MSESSVSYWNPKTHGLEVKSKSATTKKKQEQSIHRTEKKSVALAEKKTHTHQKNQMETSVTTLLLHRH